MNLSEAHEYIRLWEICDMECEVCAVEDCLEAMKAIFNSLEDIQL